MKCKESSLWDTTYKLDELEVSGPIEGLFTWDEAMSLKLPEGWRVASDADWTKIEHYFNNNAKKLIKKLGIVFTGFRLRAEVCYIGGSADFWSSSESGTFAWYRSLYSRDATVYRDMDTKELGFSVRCVRDIESQ